MFTVVAWLLCKSVTEVLTAWCLQFRVKMVL